MGVPARLDGGQFPGRPWNPLPETEAVATTVSAGLVVFVGCIIPRSRFSKSGVRGEGVRLTRTFARGPVWGKTTRAVNGSHAGDCAPACKCHDVSPSKSICKRLENHRKTRVKPSTVRSGL